MSRNSSSSTDLFTPSLRSDDDATEFFEPWNPNVLVFLTFLFGGMAGGSLLAANFKRLGIQGRFWPTVLGFLVLTILTYAVLGVFFPLGRGADAQSTKSVLRMVRKAIAVTAALGVAAMQRKRHRLAVMTDAPRGKLLWPAVLASVVGISIEALISLAVMLPIAMAQGGR